MGYPAIKHWLAAASAPLHRQPHPKEPRLPFLEVPKKTDCVVLFSPHPDDETFFAGGFVSAACTAGATVHIVLVSDGNARGHHEERIAEFQKATRLLGVPSQNLHFYLIPDGDLDIQRDVIGLRVTETLTELNPTLVLAPHPADGHRDHHILGEVVASHTSVKLLRYLSHFPPHFPWPRKHLPAARLLPPKALQEELWHAFVIPKPARTAKSTAMQAYKRELRTPTLRSLLLAFDRVNEVYSLRD